jgi:uncharacterized membrane protein
LSPADLLLVTLRWAHSLAAVVWIGGTIFYLLVIGPARAEGGRNGEPPAFWAAASARYRELFEVSVFIFIASGALLTFDRLSRGAGTAYAALLAVKIVLALAAFHLGFRVRRRGLGANQRSLETIAALGVAIILIAALLKVVFESG